MTPRTSRLSFIVAVLLVAAIVAVAAAILLRNTAHAAPTDACDPAYTAQCCACEPSGAGSAAPLGSHLPAGRDAHAAHVGRIYAASTGTHRDT